MKELTVKKISKKVGKFEIKDISFKLPAGYILGVIGRNGCGKTTLIRTLLGMYRLPKDSNMNILIDDVSAKTDIKEYKMKIAYVLCDEPFPVYMKALEIGELYGRYYEKFDMERFERLITEYEIPLKRRIDQMSKGQEMKLQLAFAVSTNAEVYYMDEPTANLDVEFRDEFYKVVRELVSNEECSVIYSSHLIEELEGFADYILWIKRDENEATEKYFGTLEELKDCYQLIEADIPVPADKIAGKRIRDNHSEILLKVRRDELTEEQREYARYAELNEIMYYEEKGGEV